MGGNEGKFDCIMFYFAGVRGNLILIYLAARVSVRQLDLAISLVCLICNISLLRETRRLVAIRVVSVLGSSGRL